MENPSPDTEVTLIVDLVIDDATEATERVNSIGPTTTVEETLPFGSMVVSIPESKLKELYDVDVVASMEMEGEGTVLASGNR